MNKRYFSSFPDPKDKGDATSDAIVTVHAPITEFQEIKIEIPQIPDAPEIEEFEFISLTVEQIKEMSNDELKSVLSGAYQPEKILPMPLQSLIVCELNDRSIKKSSNPHWWIGIVSIALTAIGVWIAYQSLSPQNEQHDSRAIEFDEYLNSEKRLEKSVQGFEELRKEKKQEQETSDGLMHGQDLAAPLESLEQGTSEQEEIKE